MTTADLLGKILQVVMGLAIFAAIVGLLIFLIDRAPKKGRDYWQLAGFLLPAILLLLIGLVYPAIRTTGLAFVDNQGDFTWNNFIWMFTQPAAIRTLINTVIWVLLVPTLATALGLEHGPPPRPSGDVEGTARGGAPAVPQARRSRCRDRPRLRRRLPARHGRQTLGAATLSASSDRCGCRRNCRRRPWA